MYVRRKSNWYIYLLSFVITAAFVIVAIFVFKWYLFPTDTQNTGLNKQGELDENFSPTAEHSFNMLGILSDGVYDSPEMFFIVSYNAPANGLTFIPIPNGISVASQGRTLPNVYAAQGGAEVVNVIENEIGIRCSSYVKMDSQSFEDLLTAFGNVEYDIPRTITVRDGENMVTFNSGRNLLTSKEVFQLVYKAEYDEGESYKFRTAADIFAELINQNYRHVDGGLLDTYFGLIVNNAETNLTEQLYKAHKRALLNTVEYGVQPADYYIPYGEYTDDGGFKIAYNSIVSIKQRAGLL